ncbi:hypothetical protein ABZU88_21870 [Streptomyces sp. NPDC005245]|uniref:hypothetical protein n=1 Tax=Streptomyces sp. NPDC005245 TaxID=3157029 RepID=UPI0033B5F549
MSGRGVLTCRVRRVGLIFDLCGGRPPVGGGEPMSRVTEEGQPPVAQAWIAA